MDRKMKIFEVNEISSDLEIGKFYSLLGLINSRPYFSNIGNGITVQKLSLINLDRVNIILEIWNDSSTMELTFAKDWKQLQLIFIRDAKFQGVMKLAEQQLTYIFQISSKNKSERFIWLSSPSLKFWDEPLLPHSFLTRDISAEEIESIELEVITKSSYKIFVAE